MGVRSSWLASDTNRIWALYAWFTRSIISLMAWARERSSFWVAGQVDTAVQMGGIDLIQLVSQALQLPFRHVQSWS